MNLRKLLRLLLLFALAAAMISCGCEAGAGHTSSLPYSEAGESEDPYFPNVSRSVKDAEKPFLSENDTIDPEDVPAAVDAVYAAAKDLPGVVDCKKYDGAVLIEMKEGLDCVYFPRIEGADTGDSDLEIITFQPFDTENRENNPKLDHNGLDDSARLLAQLDARWCFPSENNVNDRQVTLDRILHMDEAKLVLWHGHGGFLDDEFVLGTNIKVTAALNSRYGILRNKTEFYRSVEGNLGLRTAFFENHFSENAFENAILYFATCESGRTADFANVFIEKGAAVVFVNSKSIFREYNLNMLHLVIDSFITGGTGEVSRKAMSEMRGFSFNSPNNWSIEDSLLFAKARYGESDLFLFGAKVYYVGDGGVNRMTYADWLKRFDQCNLWNAIDHSDVLRLLGAPYSEIREIAGPLETVTVELDDFFVFHYGFTGLRGYTFGFDADLSSLDPYERCEIQGSAAERCVSGSEPCEGIFVSSLSLLGFDESLNAKEIGAEVCDLMNSGEVWIASVERDGRTYVFSCAEDGTIDRNSCVWVYPVFQ